MIKVECVVVKFISSGKKAAGPLEETGGGKGSLEG